MSLTRLLYGDCLHCPNGNWSAQIESGSKTIDAEEAEKWTIATLQLFGIKYTEHLSK